MQVSQDVRDALDVTSVNELEACVRRFGESRGFARYSLSKIHQLPWTQCELLVSRANYPEKYVQAIYDDREVGKTDPVMQYVKTHHTPIWWTSKTYDKVGRREQWERAVELDGEMYAGVMLAMHLPDGYHVSIGLESREVVSFGPDRMQWLSSELALLLMHSTQFLTSTRCTGEPKTEPAIRLTERGSQVLRLIAQGRTNKQISSDLGITERTVVKHLADSAERLGCAHARRELMLARALELNLLGPTLHA